jgi:DNA-binding PadR family transcriptional regulator
MTNQPKSDRGVVHRLVLSIARRGKPFSRRDVPDARGSVYNRLHCLAKQGVLKVVRKGRPGRLGGRQAIYKLNKP